MNRMQRISKILEKNLNEFNIKIVDNSHKHRGHNDFDGLGETHIKIILNKNSNQKFNRLDIHRKINDLLKKEYEIGLHSLEININ